MVLRNGSWFVDPKTMKYTKPNLLKACNISEKKRKKPIFQVQHNSVVSLVMPAAAGQNDHCKTK